MDRLWRELVLRGSRVGHAGNTGHFRTAQLLTWKGHSSEQGSVCRVFGAASVHVKPLVYASEKGLVNLENYIYPLNSHLNFVIITLEKVAIGP